MNYKKMKKEIIDNAKKSLTVNDVIKPDELTNLLKDFDFEAFSKKMKKEEERAIKPAEEIIQILSKLETFDRHKVAEEVGKRIHKLHYKDETPSLNNFVIDSIIDGQINEYAKTILEQVNYIRDNQGKNEIYGDIDNTFKIILSDNKKDVMTIKNHCSCADDVYWIIINDKENKKFHVRIIYDNSDYPRSEYPKRLSLKFYKDRGWTMNFIEKFHATKLGGCYGDIRDNGYVISFGYDKTYSMDCDQNISFINSQRNFVSNLSCIYSQCKKRKENEIK